MNRTWAAQAFTASLTVAAAAVPSSAAVAAASQTGPSTERPTFAKDIAPIIFAHCSTCHRPGGSAPFSLLTYADVATRGRQIASAVTRRQMPPWKPEPGYGEFVGERRLTDEQISLIVRWIDEGTARGDAAALPPAPRWPDKWQLGQPDLVITMPEPYNLPADGLDVFRNFVIPIPIPATQYIRAWEFWPGNVNVVHHATMHLDPAGASRQLDEQDPEPGYEGLAPFSVKDPSGYFLGWTPGQKPDVAAAEVAWTLQPGSDLVLMLHLRPTGRPETIQASLGLYFSDVPPSRVPAMLRLGRQDIDIPAGEKRYTITDSFELPVDVYVQTVYPHAHYRAKDIKGFATLPDGTRQWLLYIKEWDFNWQDVYRYVKPIFLPAGSTLAMEYTYDNSAENPHNPFNPPRRVTFGKNSSDEMGDLWVQVVPRETGGLDKLTEAFSRKLLPATISGVEMMLRAEPENRALHDEAALLHVHAGSLENAAVHFAEAVRIAPESPAAHYNLGSMLLRVGKPDEAEPHLQKALQLRPDYAAAHHNLGIIFQQRHEFDRAAEHYREAMRLEPGNADAHYHLGVVLQSQEKVDEAIAEYHEALRLQPSYPAAHYLLGAALRSQGHLREAAQQYRQALQARPEWTLPMIELAWVLATSSDPEIRRPGEAFVLAQRAARITSPAPASVLDVLAAAFAALGEFDRAIATAESALASAIAGAGDADAVKRIQERLNLYRQRRPYVAPQ